MASTGAVLATVAERVLSLLCARNRKCKARLRDPRAASINTERWSTRSTKHSAHTSIVRWQIGY